LLYVGTIEERKNLLLLAKALPYLPRNINIVAIGRQTPYADKVKKQLQKSGLTQRVKFMTNIPSDVLPAIYQLAEIFVYPSKYEGFGIPMLEALCSGIPAIGAKGSSLEEAGGPSSIYVNPEDEKELADAINQILADESLRKSMIADGYKYAEQFLPERLVENLSEVYLDVLNENTLPTKH
jgi:glycosyltransferase involved in cell wall biosynthesis